MIIRVLVFKDDYENIYARALGTPMCGSGYTVAEACGVLCKIIAWWERECEGCEGKPFITKADHDLLKVYRAVRDSKPVPDNIVGIARISNDTNQWDAYSYGAVGWQPDNPVRKKQEPRYCDSCEFFRTYDDEPELFKGALSGATRSLGYCDFFSEFKDMRSAKDCKEFKSDMSS